MLLNLLSTVEEKTFFLNFAYLIAVAEDNVPESEQPKSAYTDSPETNEFAFEDFASGFAMRTSELLVLRKFAEEVEIKNWAPVFEWNPFHAVLVSLEGQSPSALESLIGKMLSEMPGNVKELATVPADKEKESALREILKSVPPVSRCLSKAASIMPKQGDSLSPKNRLAVLWAAFVSMLPEGAENYSERSKRIMLLEATAMAYADGGLSSEETFLLQLFCQRLRVDSGLIEEFTDISRQFFSLHAKSLEIVNE